MSPVKPLFVLGNQASFATLRYVLYPRYPPDMASIIMTGSTTHITGKNQVLSTASKGARKIETKNRVQIGWVV